MEKYKFRKEHSVSSIHEISVDWNGWNFLIIYGKHINGWFIAIPNWELCVEASEPTNVDFNTARLYSKIEDYNRSRALAKAICEHWEGNNESED